MTTITSDDFTPIYQAIAKSETLYPPRLMRTLKKKIFQMDLSTHGTVTTRGFDGISSLPEDAKIIIGIGADTTSKGSPVKANDIYLDAVFDNMNLNPRLVVEQYLPDLLKHNTGGLPIFKYLEVYEGELYDKVSEFAKNHTAIDSYLNSAYRSQKKSFRKQLDVKTVSAIIEMEQARQPLQKALLSRNRRIRYRQLGDAAQDGHREQPSHFQRLSGNKEADQDLRFP